jgi:hypothetical protein
MGTKMKEITKKTLREINKKFKTNRGFILSVENPIYCPQVDGLVNICLIELGFLKESGENCQAFFESKSFNPSSGLFYREVDLDGKVKAPFFNTGKNSIFALALSLSNLKDKAENIMNNLRQSPAYNYQTGLYSREYNPSTKEVNHLIITQSNLWVALSLIKLGKKAEANQIIKYLENKRLDKEKNLFISQDCRFKESKETYFCDDQALAVLVYLSLGEKDKAQRLMKTTIEEFYDFKTGLFNSTSLDDTKSTYKNSFVAFALGRLGMNEYLSKVQKGLVRYLYDPQEKLFRQSTNDATKIPDNSALALVALEYGNIKHEVF